jgi:hypothetical protein
MDLQECKKMFDFEGAIILLEGKRNVLDVDKAKLIALGKLLCSSTSHMMFRSGNASGADQYFSEGVASVDKNRLHVLTPYTDHRKKTNLAYETFALDQIDIAKEENVIYQSKNNKKTKGLIDSYIAGEVNKNTIKAAYILRDTVKVIGTSTIKPAHLGIFYDDLNNPKTGGTGHTMNICQLNQIPLIDQRTWFQWL